MGGGGEIGTALTLRLKLVVRVCPPPLALTETGYLPAGVVPLVLTVSVDEHAGVQDAEEKAPVAPEGKPETANETF